MIKKRIFSVILAVLLVITCASEALFIKFLQNDANNMEKETEELRKELRVQNALMQTLKDEVDRQKEAAVIRLYLPDDIYLCQTKESEIYYDSIVYGIDSNSYICRFESEIGICHDDYYEIPPMSPAGDYDATLYIYDLDFNELISRDFCFHVVPDYLMAEDETDAGLDSLRLMIISADGQDDVPEYLAEYTKSSYHQDGGAAAPGIVIVFPLYYEVYADPDETLKNAADLVTQIRTVYPDTQILLVEPTYPVSDLDKVFAGDDTVWVVSNVPESREDAIYGMLCRFIGEKQGPAVLSEEVEGVNYDEP